MTSLPTTTWIKQDDGSQTAKLCLVHLHFPHLGDEFSEDAVKDCAHACLVSTTSVYMESCSQQDTVLHHNRSVGECSN